MTKNGKEKKRNVEASISNEKDLTSQITARHQAKQENGDKKSNDSN